MVSSRLSKVSFVFVTFFLLIISFVFAAVSDVRFYQNETVGYDNNGNFTLNWTDAAADADNYTIYEINASDNSVLRSFQNDSITGATINTSLGDGIYFYNISANGTATNVSSSNITVDTTNPAVTDSNTNDTVVKSSKVVRINVTVKDTNLDTVIVGNTSNFTMTSIGSDVYEINKSASDFGCSTDGSCILTFYANDSATNLNDTETLTLTVDDSNPSISYNDNTDNNSANVSRDWIFVNVSLSNTNFENVTFYLYYRNGTLVDNTTNTSSSENYINWTNLSDEEYTFNVTTYDSAGNFNSTDSRNITVDTTDPSVTLTLDDSKITRGDPVKATCTTSDNLDNSMSIVITLVKENGDTHVSTGSGTSHTKTFIGSETNPTGNHKVKCDVTDNSGNSNTAEKKLEIVSSDSSSGGGSGGSSDTNDTNDTSTQEQPVNDTTNDQQDDQNNNDDTTNDQVNEVPEPQPKEEPKQDDGSTKEQNVVNENKGLLSKMKENLSATIGLGIASVAIILAIVGYFVFL